MSRMIIIQKTIVSEELITRRFCCNVSKCLGACCIEGDAGAPLEKKEVCLLKRHLAPIMDFMEKKAAAVIAKTGISVHDDFGNIVTPLFQGKECIFVKFENGIATCAIEKAYEAGKIPFGKPVSCHLYPVRLSLLSDHIAVNIHEWHVCKTAWQEGKAKNIPVYVFLKDALIRRFGREWYDQLEAAAALHKGSGM